jgi:hypothetical protein
VSTLTLSETRAWVNVDTFSRATRHRRTGRICRRWPSRGPLLASLLEVLAPPDLLRLGSIATLGRSRPPRSSPRGSTPRAPARRAEPRQAVVAPRAAVSTVDSQDLETDAPVHRVHAPVRVDPTATTRSVRPAGVSLETLGEADPCSAYVGGCSTRRGPILHASTKSP